MSCEELSSTLLPLLLDRHASESAYDHCIPNHFVTIPNAGPQGSEEGEEGDHLESLFVYD